MRSYFFDIDFMIDTLNGSKDSVEGFFKEYYPTMSASDLTPEEETKFIKSLYWCTSCEFWYTYDDPHYESVICGD